MVEPVYMDSVTGKGWESVLKPMERQGWNPANLEKQLNDYLSPLKTPGGVDYPSIKPVPMFNEMWVEGIRLNGPTRQLADGTTAYVYTAEMKVGFETWFPFPAEENGGGTYRIDAPTVTMQSSEGSGIWVEVALQLSSGEIQQVTQKTCSVDKASVEFPADFGDGKPRVHEFTYAVQFQTVEPVTDSDADLICQAGWNVTDDIDLIDANGTTVDRLPTGVGFRMSNCVLKQGAASGRFSMEVTDPRLNHLPEQWQQAASDAGSAGEINDVTKELEAFQMAGPWMYCQNGEMKSLAEFGNFSRGKPWQTLDLSADGGRDVLALGVLVHGWQGSDDLQEAIRVRNLMRTGLAAAQNDYSEALWRARKYVPDEDWEVFSSEANGLDAISGEEGTLGGSGVVIPNGEVLEWLPARYKTGAVMEKMEDAKWILVRETPGTNSRIVGRYAYVCLDSSGGMDANWVARNDEVANRDTRALTNRSHHSIRDIPMGLLPEVTDAASFKAYRNGWKGFDSLPMLARLTDGVCVDGTDKTSTNSCWQSERREYASALDSKHVSDLTTYGLTAYRGGRYNRGTGVWEQPHYMDPATGAGWEAVMAPLQGQGWSRGDLECQLQDYLSSSRAPRGVDYPSIKAVPMFNEMWVKGIKLNAPTMQYVNGLNTYVYTAEVKVGFETWFPFPSADNQGGTYRINAPMVTMQSSSGSGIWIPVALQLSSGTIQQVTQWNCTPDKAYETFEATYGNGKPQKVAEFTYKVEFRTTNAIKDPNAKLVWRVGWMAQDSIDLTDSSGMTVDRLVKGIKFSTSQDVFQQGQASGAFSLEVTDPRLNHSVWEWQKADSDEGSPGEINDVTKGLPDFSKEGPWMYCRNGKMESLAEFGYFSTGKPWQTLDLCTDEGREFLAQGTLNKGIKDALDKAGVYYTNSTININTRRMNVLASAFYDLSYMSTPNMDASIIEKECVFSEEQARELAKRIQTETAGEPYQSGQDWAKSAAMRDGGYLEVQGLTRTERESVLRNTDGLFNVGDNLFTVVVVAQSVQEEAENVGIWDNRDQITGERCGVALVWMYPFKVGANLRNEMMVRVFRSLDASDGTSQSVARKSREMAGERSNVGAAVRVDAGEKEGNARSQKNAESDAGMVLVPGGTNGGDDPDFGAYSLTVGSFWMDRTEVSLAEWRQVYEWAVAHGYDFDHEGEGKEENHPVHTVSWFDCAKWCNARSEMEGQSPVYTVGGAVYRTGRAIPEANLDRAGYRLPTGEEWEYAARGGLQGRRFPWGDTIWDSDANYFASPWHPGEKNSMADDYSYNGTIPYTASVVSFRTNGCGVRNMVGNVGEWTDCAARGWWSCRGGGWDNNASDCRCGISCWVSPYRASYDVGFRTVCRTRFTTNTPVAVPFEWLERYPEALEAYGGDHEAFAADTAENGRPVWACYVADLDPTDAESELRVGLERDEEGNWVPRIVSGESMERRYVFEGAEWMPTGDGEEGAEWGEVGEGSRFFRARVEVEREE